MMAWIGHDAVRIIKYAGEIVGLAGSGEFTHTVVDTEGQVFASCDTTLGKEISLIAELVTVVLEKDSLCRRDRSIRQWQCGRSG